MTNSATPNSAQSKAHPQALPEDAVLLGHVSAAFGIKGWVKVHPYAQPASHPGQTQVGSADSVLLASTQWWLHWAQRGTQQAVKPTEVLKSQWHSGAVIAQLNGVDDRNQAEALRGAEVWVPRSAFPATADDEYYFVDLIGMTVWNQQDQLLGTVVEVFDNGAHEVLVLDTPALTPAGKPKQSMLPFVDAYVLEVDDDAKLIRVDWLAEWDV
jgi:16S rRNA processing protein RimM